MSLPIGNSGAGTTLPDNWDLIPKGEYITVALVSGIVSGSFVVFCLWLFESALEMYSRWRETHLSESLEDSADLDPEPWVSVAPHSVQIAKDIVKAYEENIRIDKG